MHPVSMELSAGETLHVQADVMCRLAIMVVRGRGAALRHGATMSPELDAGDVWTWQVPAAWADCGTVEMEVADVHDPARRPALLSIQPSTPRQQSIPTVRRAGAASSHAQAPLHVAAPLAAAGPASALAVPVLARPRHGMLAESSARAASVASSSSSFSHTSSSVSSNSSSARPGRRRPGSRALHRQLHSSNSAGSTPRQARTPGTAEQQQLLARTVAAAAESVAAVATAAADMARPGSVAHTPPRLATRAADQAKALLPAGSPARSVASEGGVSLAGTFASVDTGPRTEPLLASFASPSALAAMTPPRAAAAATAAAASRPDERSRVTLSPVRATSDAAIWAARLWTGRAGAAPVPPATVPAAEALPPSLPAPPAPMPWTSPSALGLACVLACNHLQELRGGIAMARSNSSKQSSPAGQSPAQRSASLMARILLEAVSLHMAGVEVDASGTCWRASGSTPVKYHSRVTLRTHASAAGCAFDPPLVRVPVGGSVTWHAAASVTDTWQVEGRASAAASALVDECAALMQHEKLSPAVLHDAAGKHRGAAHACAAALAALSDMNVQPEQLRAAMGQCTYWEVDVPGGGGSGNVQFKQPGVYLYQHFLSPAAKGVVHVVPTAAVSAVYEGDPQPVQPARDATSPASDSAEQLQTGARASSASWQGEDPATRRSVSPEPGRRASRLRTQAAGAGAVVKAGSPAQTAQRMGSDAAALPTGTSAPRSSAASAAQAEPACSATASHPPPQIAASAPSVASTSCSGLESLLCSDSSDSDELHWGDMLGSPERASPDGQRWTMVSQPAAETAAQAPTRRPNAALLAHTRARWRQQQQTGPITPRTPVPPMSPTAESTAPSTLVSSIAGSAGRKVRRRRGTRGQGRRANMASAGTPASVASSAIDSTCTPCSAPRTARTESIASGGSQQHTGESKRARRRRRRGSSGAQFTQTARVLPFDATDSVPDSVEWADSATTPPELPAELLQWRLAQVQQAVGSTFDGCTVVAYTVDAAL